MVRERGVARDQTRPESSSADAVLRLDLADVAAPSAAEIMKLSTEAADMAPLPRDHYVLLMQSMDRAKGHLAVHLSLASDISQDVEDVDERVDHRHTTHLATDVR